MPIQRLALLIAGGLVVIATLFVIRLVGAPEKSNIRVETSSAPSGETFDILDDKTFTIIKKNFPEFYSEFVEDLKAHTDLGIDNAAISEFATLRIATFRRNNARYILNVTDKTASGLIQDYLATMELVLTHRGETGCARYANEGMLAFQDDPIVETLSPMLHDHAAKVMAALAEGKKRGEFPETIDAADWTTFRETLAQNEAGRAALSVLYEGGIGDASICTALGTYLAALLSYNGDGAYALRAEMAYGIIAN